MANINNMNCYTGKNLISQLRKRGSHVKSIQNNQNYLEDSHALEDMHVFQERTDATPMKTSTIFPELTSNKKTAIRKTTTTTPQFMANKRSLSESSADEANRSIETLARNGSPKAQRMWQNELSINPDSADAQPAAERRQQGLSNYSDLNDNINEKYKQNHSFSDMIDVGIRIAMVVIFVKLETTSAFQRNIHVEELWLYKNPRTDDIVTPRDLILSVILSPLAISVLHYLLTRDRRDFRAANWAWTLSLCLNGITTSLIKITTGRPRPDFFYRCFPDGQLVANVTPTAVNFNCTGNWRVINEGYKSFPSGHSSFAFCSFGFIAFYMAGKLHSFNTAGRGETWRLFPAVLPLWLATLVGISRTCDYHHHWQDVTVGGFIGLAVAYITYRQYFPSIFSRHSHRPLPRDGRYNNCCSSNCFKNDYLHRLNDDYSCETDTLATNALLNASDDQLPLICDDDNNQKQRSQ